MEYLKVSSARDVKTAVFNYCGGEDDVQAVMVSLVCQAPNRPQYGTNWAPWWNACTDTLFRAAVAIAMAAEAEHLPITNQRDLECVIHQKFDAEAELLTAVALMLRDMPGRPEYGAEGAKWAAWWNEHAVAVYRQVVENAICGMCVSEEGL